MNLLGEGCHQCDGIPVLLEKLDATKVMPTKILHDHRAAEVAWG